MFKIVYSLNNKQRLKLFILMIIVILSGILSFVPIRLMETLVNDSVIGNDGTTIILKVGVAYISLQVLFALTKALSDYLTSRFQAKISSDIQKELYKKTTDMDLSYLMKKESSDIINSLVDDINVISEKSLDSLKRTVSASTTFVIGVIYIVSINWILAIIIISLGLITAILNWFTQKKFIYNAERKKCFNIFVEIFF